MNKWEIWLAQVAFEDFPERHKKRPVLVLQTGTVVILSTKITGHEPRSYCWGEYKIIDWRGAGLVKQSTIRLSKRFGLSSDAFIRKLGDLQPIDRMNIEKLLDELNE